MPDISQKVLEQIDKEHIQPKPRWQFLLNAWVIRVLLILSILLGSLACAVFLFYVYDFDWEVYYDFSNRWIFLLMDIPYLWIIFTLLFIGSAYYHFKHTQRGYRWGFSVTIMASLALSFIGGVVVYSFTDLPETLEDLAVQNVPFYEQVMVTKENRWLRPEIGLLNGMIEEVQGQAEAGFRLRDMHNKLWYINITEVKPPHPPLINGIRIRLEGHQTGPDRFRAFRILPWFIRPPKPRFFPLLKPPLQQFREKMKENFLPDRTTP